MINSKRKHTGYSDYDYVTSNEEKPIVYAVSGALIAACFFFALPASAYLEEDLSRLDRICR